MIKDQEPDPLAFPGTMPVARGRIGIRQLDLDTQTMTHFMKCMKPITINVSEPVYEAFQGFAKKVDRKTSELIREAMEEYHRTHIQRRTSLRDRQPTSVGGPIQPIDADDDILGEMLDDPRG